jgi:hypothetical protein
MLVLATQGDWLMTALDEHVPRQRTWWLWLGLAGAVLVLLSALYWWLLLHRALSDEERPFVGTWRLEFPTFSASRPELITEIGLLHDGTIHERVWDSRTGAVVHDAPGPDRWHVSNGRFQRFVQGNVLHGILGIGESTAMLTDCVVTWDGVDRFRLDDSSHTRPTQVWLRSDGPGSP